MLGHDDKDRNSAEQLRAMQTEEPEVLAEFFRSFADPTRIRILNVLAGGEICVGDLATSLELAVKTDIDEEPGFRWDTEEPGPIPVTVALLEKGGYIQEA